jgi:hypothetical protein
MSSVGNPEPLSHPKSLRAQFRLTIFFGMELISLGKEVEYFSSFYKKQVQSIQL